MHILAKVRADISKYEKKVLKFIYLVIQCLKLTDTV